MYSRTRLCVARTRRAGRLLICRLRVLVVPLPQERLQYCCQFMIDQLLHKLGVHFDSSPNKISTKRARNGTTICSRSRRRPGAPEPGCASTPRCSWTPRRPSATGRARRAQEAQAGLSLLSCKSPRRTSSSDGRRRVGGVGGGALLLADDARGARLLATAMPDARRLGYSATTYRCW